MYKLFTLTYLSLDFAMAFVFRPPAPRLFLLVVALSGAIAPSCAAPSQNSRSDNSTDSVKVAVTQIVEHPSLNAVRDGLKTELESLGYSDGKNLSWSWESAQGNPSTATQIAQKLVGNRPDVIVAISTPSAQAAAATTPDIPIIFSAVTDPVEAKLVASIAAPGGNVTGVSDLTPVGEHLALIQRIVPTVKTVGVIYNAGEANSVSSVARLTAEAATRGIALKEATATNTAGVSTAAKSLVGVVDAIYVPTDNTVASALEAVLQVGIDNQLPVFAGDNDSVERGAIASLSFDYSGIGKDTAKLVDQVLKGANPGELPVVRPTTLTLMINPRAAAQMGVEVPEEVLSEAQTVLP